MRWGGAALAGFLALGLGCQGSPIVRPTPRRLLGRCLWLHFAPSPPPIDHWQPPDTLRFVGPPWLAQTPDSAAVIWGELDLPADTSQRHFAEWRLYPGYLQLRLWTRWEERRISFGRLSEFAETSPSIRGDWIQWNRSANWRGIVTGEFVACPAPQ